MPRIHVSSDFEIWLKDVRKRSNGDLNGIAITHMLATNLRINKTDFVVNPDQRSRRRRRVKLKSTDDQNLFRPFL